ncbi:MAG TPA: MarR family winged helix-turn-helix transcriptional regulator [Terricaulis sp.]|mgnify:CR=1 FL=1|nr:MarR family winged helix-turn-helix transcriptional regulator [Terricaulis sp.]
MPKRKPAPDYPPCLYLRMRIATKRLLTLYDAHLAEAQLSMPQFGLLIATAEEPDLTMARLAAKRDISPSTLTRTLKPLEAAGLVETYADPASKRTRRARLTPQGRVRMRAGYAAWKQAQAEASDILPPKLVAQVLRATEQLA